MPHNNTNIIQAKYFLMVFLQAMISFDLRTSIAVFSCYWGYDHYINS